MQVRDKKTKIVWGASRFNTHALGEILVGHKDYGMDSAYIRDFDVYLESKKEWKDMGTAFKDHDLIIDNNNTIFLEPKNEEDRKRGYTL